ncbi:MAG: ATP-binding protein [Cyanobacteria bacterium P01_F01_bin.86]
MSYRSGDLSAYLTEIVLGISRLIQTDWTIITISEGKTGQVIASNLDMSPKDTEFSIYGTLAGEVIQSGRLLIIKDGRQSLAHHQLPKAYLCYLGIPLKITSGEVIGTICSFCREPRSFMASEIKIVELFAERTATAIDNYRLYQQQKQLNKELSQTVSAYSIDLKLSQKKLIEYERLAAIGEFTAMIVHEVRNPLTTIQLGLAHAQKVLHADADQQRLGLALSESHRLNRLLCEILSYAKSQTLRLSRLNISKFINDLLIQIQHLPEATGRRISYVRECSEFEVMADPDKLKQVFLNLLRNAYEAISIGDEITCTLTLGKTPSQICIRIHNGGEPIPSELLPRLTQPFFSTKSSGTGLGLAISKQIIIAHDGELEITSSSAGTIVSVYLPRMTSISLD